MEKIIKRWEVTRNWQLLYPILGALLVMGTSIVLALRIVHLFKINNTYAKWVFIIGAGIGFYYLMKRFFIWCFKKLENKWEVTYKWEMIAIFIVFAITGSMAGKLAGPLTEWIGLGKTNVNGFIYWTARILLIFPIYQVILVLVGWVFGQFKFFWNFEKKMLKRMGLGFLIP